MSGSAATPSWRERLTALPERPRGFYLQQAVLIGLAMLAALSAIYVTYALDGSILWIIGADILVMLACGRSAWRILGFFSLMAGAAEGFILAILAFMALLFAIPLLAPIFLVWNVIQAVRARPAGPGEDDGWF